MKENVVKQKSFSFALGIIKMFKVLSQQQKEFVLSKQLLRSGTAIGALVWEAEQAESKPDFVHKMSIALKEAHETGYWIELLYQSGYLDGDHHISTSTDLAELIKLLTAIIKTTKARM